MHLGSIKSNNSKGQSHNNKAPNIQRAWPTCFTQNNSPVLYALPPIDGHHVTLLWAVLDQSNEPDTKNINSFVGNKRESVLIQG